MSPTAARLDLRGAPVASRGVDDGERGGGERARLRRPVRLRRARLRGEARLKPVAQGAIGRRRDAQSRVEPRRRELRDEPVGGDQQRRHLVQTLAGRRRLDAHAAGRVGKRGERFDHVLAREPVVLHRGVGLERDAGEGGKPRLQTHGDARRLGELPVRPDVAEEMGDRRADQRVGKAGENRRGQPWLGEMQRNQRR